MKQIACVVAWLAIVAGCQPSAEQTAAAVPAGYRADIENLCDAVARSGADQRPAEEHALVIASWLASHLTTEDAHHYLVQIQPLGGDAKAAALEAEAQRVGLPRCALAAVWRAAAP